MTKGTQRQNVWHALTLVASCVVLAGFAAMICGCDSPLDTLLEPLTGALNKASTNDSLSLGAVNDGSNGENNSDPIYADFSQRDIKTSNMDIYPGTGFMYNGVYGHSWLIACQYGSFMGTFTAPSAGTYDLTVTHLSSAYSGSPGGGYSPVTISVNNTTVVRDYDPASNHDGTHNWVTDTFPITVNAGSNTIRWAAGATYTKYWINSINIAPQQAP